jgi:3-deoxy-manno-octulosonate cytidylyltransferase (CMP-KDO synthetase)
MARSLDRVVVATDDRRIADAVRGFGGEVAMTGEAHRSGTDRIAEVARKLRGLGWVVNIQGDEPLVEPALIDRLVREIRRTGEEMATAATAFEPGDSPENPNAVKVVCRLDGTALYFSRSRIPFRRDEGSEPEMLRHIGIYAYRRDFLLRYVRWGVSRLEASEQLEQLRALEHGASIRVIRSGPCAPGVDTPEDARLVGRLIEESVVGGRKIERLRKTKR